MMSRRGKIGLTIIVIFLVTFEYLWSFVFFPAENHPSDAVFIQVGQWSMFIIALILVINIRQKSLSSLSQTSNTTQSRQALPVSERLRAIAGLVLWVIITTFIWGFFIPVEQGDDFGPGLAVFMLGLLAAIGAAIVGSIVMGLVKTRTTAKKIIVGLGALYIVILLIVSIINFKEDRGSRGVGRADTAGEAERGVIGVSKVEK